MDEKKKWQIDLNEYIRQGEPEQVEKSEAWQIAIGLQQVDGLTTSDYLLNTAKDHMEKSTLKKHRRGSTAIMRSSQNAKKLKRIQRKQI